MSDLPATRKSLGQHWLNDTTVLQSIADAADIQPSDTVLEIGPGPGTLTKILVQQAQEVVAVELDEKLALALPSWVPVANLRVVVQSILEFDLTSLPPVYKLVANIPYYLTSNLIRVLSESSNPPAIAVLLIQKEVAERVVSVPGNMSILSVSAQYYWDVSVGPLVGAEMFTPRPKVDSQVLILRARTAPLYDDVTDPSQFFRIVKAGFSGKRKTLLNSLSAGLALPKDQTRSLLEEAGVDPGLRAQTLSLDEWHSLYKYNTHQG
jgi:16S rRNA (adenine1518-N6/adenine1519-N6)-dimethyltransferase